MASIPFRREAPAETEPQTPWVRSVASGAGVGLAAGMTLTASASAVAAYLARVVVTPVHEKRADVEILAVIQTSHGQEVVLTSTPETIVSGTYGLHFDAGRGLARVGEVTALEPKHGTVTRRVEEVVDGDLRAARRGWISSGFHRDPGQAGFEVQEVTVDTPVGEAPAWFVPASDPQAPLAGRNIWAIMVHGRAGTRVEGIKALPAAQQLGLDSLLISYRNDGEAPAAPDGRYGLGMTEWEDVEAAVRYALDHGAEDVLLFGWSMGGAICLQAADRSQLAPAVRGLVLTGPVIDWIDVLAHQARVNRVPESVGKLSRWLLSHPRGRRVTGLASPLDLKAMNWIDRAEQLHTRTLILHSQDDETVPHGPGRDLAEKNGLVCFEPFTQARHVKEWNHDPERWNGRVTSWVTDLFSEAEPGA